MYEFILYSSALKRKRVQEKINLNPDIPQNMNKELCFNYLFPFLTKTKFTVYRPVYASNCPYSFHLFHSLDESKGLYGHTSGLASLTSFFSNQSPPTSLKPHQLIVRIKWHGSFRVQLLLMMTCVRLRRPAEGFIL